MRRRLILIIPAIAVLAGCASGSLPPSLLPRPAEAIDPRLPVIKPMNDRPVDPALAGKLAELVNQARNGDSTFRAAAAEAERLAASAGPAQSESWIVAQEALSAAVSAREPTARAMGDIDALGGDKLQAQGGLAPADLDAIDRAGAEVGAIDQRQAETIKTVQSMLAH
jgi:hypothetical protein